MKFVYVLTHWYDRGDEIIGVFSSLESAIEATPKDRESRWVTQRAELYNGGDAEHLSYERVGSWEGYGIQKCEVR